MLHVYVYFLFATVYSYVISGMYVVELSSELRKKLPVPKSIAWELIPFATF